MGPRSTHTHPLHENPKAGHLAKDRAITHIANTHGPKATNTIAGGIRVGRLYPEFLSLLEKPLLDPWHRQHRAAKF